MKDFDVTALGELLIDFTEMEKAARGILCLRQIREERPVMCFLCFRSWDIRQRLSER